MEKLLPKIKEISNGKANTNTQMFSFQDIPVSHRIPKSTTCKITESNFNTKSVKNKIRDTRMQHQPEILQH